MSEVLAQTTHTAYYITYYLQHSTLIKKLTKHIYCNIISCQSTYEYYCNVIWRLCQCNMMKCTCKCAISDIILDKCN